MAIKKRPFIALVLFLLILFVVGSGLLGFYTEWLWFKSLGYTSVFLRLINYKLLLGSVFGRPPGSGPPGSGQPGSGQPGSAPAGPRS